MSKLTDFYAHKASLQEEGKPIAPQWEQLEDQLLQEELLPELAEQLRSVLSKVKSPLMFSGSYDPNDSWQAVSVTAAVRSPQAICHILLSMWQR